MDNVGVRLANQTGANIYPAPYYPIGYIYLSTIEITETQLSELYGGTWTQIKDKFLLSCGDVYSNGETGGQAEVQHKLPIAIDGGSSNNWSVLQWNKRFGYGEDLVSSPNYNNLNNTPFGSSRDLYQLRTSIETNMPPYLAVYVYTRTG